MTLLVVALAVACAGGDLTGVGTGPVPPPPPPPPPLASDVPLTVQRLDGGSGTVLVSSGIPLQPGRLEEEDLSHVRIFVGDVEQAVYVEALSGHHADGSLRTVLVQFNHAVAAGSPLEGRLVFEQGARQTTDIAKPAADRGMPAAVALPSDADYLVATELNGPTMTVEDTRAISPMFARYEDDFVAYANEHWESDADNWSAANYYDRALIYYAWWVRTANVEYWRRGTMLALNYRKNYLEPNDYGATPHWAQMEGLEQHYLLTGDEMSRAAVGGVAERLHRTFHESLGSDRWENRIQARVLQSYLLAWRLGATATESHDWAAYLDDGLTQILGTQGADGAYRFPVTCGQNMSYMAGILNDVLIKYYTQYRADDRIPGAIKRSIDFMWSTSWVPSAGAFKYYSAAVADCAETPYADLNNLILTGFAWHALRTGDPVYVGRADEIFAGAVEGAWLDGSKQFNQQYAASFRFPAYRQPF